MNKEASQQCLNRKQSTCSTVIGFPRKVAEWVDKSCRHSCHDRKQDAGFQGTCREATACCPADLKQIHVLSFLFVLEETNHRAHNAAVLTSSLASVRESSTSEKLKLATVMNWLTTDTNLSPTSCGRFFWYSSSWEQQGKEKGGEEEEQWTLYNWITWTGNVSFNCNVMIRAGLVVTHILDTFQATAQVINILFQLSHAAKKAKEKYNSWMQRGMDVSF